MSTGLHIPGNGRGKRHILDDEGASTAQQFRGVGDVATEALGRCGEPKEFPITDYKISQVSVVRVGESELRRKHDATSTTGLYALTKIKAE